MTSGADPLPAYPQYAHQLQALLRRLAREDREAIGASLRRGGFGKAEAETRQGVAHGRVRIRPDAGANTLSPYREITRTHHRVADAGSGGGRTSSIDFSRASPLSPTPRQTGPVRIPHFDMMRISRTVVPRAKDGRTHPRYPGVSGLAAAHHDYVTRGGVADFKTHLDYITRITAVEENDTALLIDMLQMDEDRRLQNQLAIISNILGGRDRERSLFEAAERCERQAKGGTLQVSTQYADDWMLATRQDVPGWVRKAAMTLHHKRLAQQKKAKAEGKPFVDVTIGIAKVDLEQAYDRLIWCDDQAVNDPDNFHFHIDGYDRPARWLTADQINAERTPCKPFEGDGCWDFEYSERKRNGKPCCPYRQNKIAEPTRDVPDAGEKAVHHFLAGERYLKSLRQRYIGIVNEVVDGRVGSPVYATGTYKDANIRLTPMEHLGPAIIAKEAKGEVTVGGTRNAHILFDDEMQLLLEKADLDRLENGFVAAIQLGRRVSAASLKATARWRELADAAVTRRCQAGLVTVVERMVRSRAETVLRADTASRVVKEEARTWLGEIDAIMAPPAQQVRVAARLENLDSNAEKAWAEVLSVTDDAPERLRYVPADPSKLPMLNPISPTYRPKVEQRLHTWLVKHRRSYKHLRFVPGGYAIDKMVPPTIHRLFRLLGDDPAIQKLLSEERQRRKVAAASAAVVRGLMEKGHDGRSILPGEGFGQGPTADDHGAHAAQSRVLADINRLQDVELLHALPTVQAKRRRNAVVEPVDDADEVDAASPARPPEPSVASTAPEGKSTGLLGQAVAAAGDRQTAEVRADLPAGRRDTGSRGPAAGTPGQASKKGQER